MDKIQVKIYKDVIDNDLHLILPKKEKYTKRDMDKLEIERLFNTKLQRVEGFTRNKARFIVLCTAIFHNAEASRTLYKAI